MKTLLVVPHYADRVSNVAQTTIGPPLGLAYLAAVLEQRRMDVSILDANARALSDEQTIEEIIRNKPEVVGFTAVTPTVDQCSEMAGALRMRLPSATIILGGPHATAVPEKTIRKYPCFDFLIRGEADWRFAELVETLGAGGSVSGLAGLTFRDKAGQVVNTRSPGVVEDLDALPFPARHLLPTHRYLGPDGGSMTTMAATRGCPYRCSYCLVPDAFGGRLRLRDPENVVEEMEQCRRQDGTRNFNFIDDTFTINRPWVESLCQRMIEKGIPDKSRWLCLTRVDAVDRALLTEMKRAGCYKVEFGIESGDESILGAVDKGITPRQVGEAFRMARECGLETLGFVIIFFPDETRRSLEKTRALVFKTDPDTLQLSFCTPYPGTELETQIKQRGFAISEDWREFIFLKNPAYEHPRFSRQEMISEQKSFYRSFYFRPRTAFRLVRYSIKNGSILGFARSVIAGLRSLLGS